MAALLLVTLVGGPLGEARADEDANLSGRFGFAFVARNNLATLGQQYRTGILWGLHAGVELDLEDSLWSLGLRLTTLVRGYYFASSSQAVDQTVDLTEAGIGLRVRRKLPGAYHHLVGAVGFGGSASNVPLPPAFERRYLGLNAGMGYERRLFGEWVWGVESRYARYFDGPSNVSLFGTFTAGFGR